MVPWCFAQGSCIDSIVHVRVIMEWGALAVRCLHHVYEIEKEIRMALRHLVTPIEEVGQLKLDARFIRKPIVRATLWAQIRRRWRTIRWKLIPILIANLACEKIQYVVMLSIDGVSTYRLVWGGILLYIFSPDLSGVQRWSGWPASGFD